MSTPPATQSLAFRVMRLCRPSFHVDTPLLLDPSDLILGEDIFDDPLAATHLPPLIDTHLTNPIDSSDLSYRSRFLLQNPSDSFGLSGLLVLPQSFGFHSLLPPPSPCLSKISLSPSKTNFFFQNNFICVGRFIWERRFAVTLALITVLILKLEILLLRLVL